MNNVKAIAFAKALDEWDRYKAELAAKAEAGVITEEERTEKLEAKACELDL